MVRTFDFNQRLIEIGRFFQGTDAVHQTMGHVVEKLEQAGIPYAIVGGMAVNAHNYQRTTGDVDFLLTAAGFADFVRRFVPGDFEPVPKRSRRFRDPTTNITFDLLITGLFPRSGEPGPIAFPDPALVNEIIKQKRVVNLPTLIELKLAARRYKDLGDVVDLIRFNDLDESFQTKLHPTVHRDYLECLEGKRREDEYEARQDEAFVQKTRAKESPPS